MSSYHTFTVTRTTEPDAAALFTQLRALDASVGVQHAARTPTYTLKKATAWTAGQITAAQNALETAPVSSAPLAAQALIDAWPIELRALALALVDQLNVIRAALPTPLAAITPAAAI